MLTYLQAHKDMSTRKFTALFSLGKKAKTSWHQSVDDLKYIMVELHKQNTKVPIKEKEMYLSVLLEKNIYQLLYR